MRVVFLSLHFAEYACRMAAALAEDHEVLLFISSPNLKEELEDAEFAPYLQHPRLTIRQLPHGRSPLMMLGNLWRLLREITAFKPDLLHLQEDSKDYLVAAVLLLRLRYPLVLTVHDPTPHSGADARAVNYSRHSLYRSILRRVCSQAITHGERMSEELATLVPRLRGRVTTAAIGPSGPQQCPPQAGEPGTLLFFGRINEYKGLRYFLDAVLLLRQRGLAVTGVIAGRGSDLPPHRALIEANDCFELHDEFISRAKLYTLFTRAEMLVMPYTDATQSGVAGMAMGFGRPVVATGVGSIPEMVLHEQTGLIVPPRDAAALADAIESLLRAPRRLAEMRAAVCAHGRRRWHYSATLSAAAYRRAVSPRAGATNQESSS